jgi:hypothetical protein
LLRQTFKENVEDDAKVLKVSSPQQRGEGGRAKRRVRSNRRR